MRLRYRPIRTLRRSEGVVWLWCETRKQGPRVAMADRRLLVGCKTFIGVELGGEVRNDV